MTRTTSQLKLILSLIFILLTSYTYSQETDSALNFFFNRPARIWEETLPLGNGRIGIMPAGGIDTELITLNEISLWSGSVQDTNNPQAGKNLDAIRQLLFDGKNKEAQDLMYDSFVCKGEGSGKADGRNIPYGSFQILGNLELHYGYQTKSDQIREYRRSLDIANAISKESFILGGTKYTREYFTSFSDDVAVIRLRAEGPHNLHFLVNLTRPERAIVSMEEQDLIMKGFMNDGVGGVGMEYAARVRVILPQGGEAKAGRSAIHVTNADEAILILAMRTNYWENFPENQVLADIEKAEKKAYEDLLSNHTELYKEKFDRLSFNLTRVEEKEALPIDMRLHKYKDDFNDPSLLSLYFQFGRYLSISSTREGLLPPNLQGLWANTLDTPWNGDYHLNINLQMNHWAVETTNLAELHRPLIDWTQSLVPSGERTAKSYYNSSGWVTHILGNLWQFTAPGEEPSWGATNTSAAWLCQHLYSHYQYSSNKEYLKRVYPTMKGSAKFFVDMLVQNPNTGYLITAPTTSPENGYKTVNGDTVHIAAGSTMDNQIIRELFTNTISASKTLNLDEDLRALLSQKRDSLMPTTVDSAGRIMEWLEDYEEVAPKHRHISHLYGLYPGNEISVLETPELAKAAKKTLIRRGDGGTGWSMAWKISFWARLYDGDKALKLINNLLNPTRTKYYPTNNQGGTYPNLFCAHPPFQIDGNLGATAGIAEMLVQSKTDRISLLPALPSAWEEGNIKGLRVQGGHLVDIVWKDGSLLSFSIYPNNNQDLSVISKSRLSSNSQIISQESYLSDYYLIKVKVRKGKKLDFSAER